MPEWPSSARRAYFLRRLHVRIDIKGTRADFGSGVLHIISAMVPSCPLRAPLRAGLPGRCAAKGKHVWGVIQVI